MIFVVSLELLQFFLSCSYGFPPFSCPELKKIQPLVKFYRFLIVQIGRAHV